MNCPECGARSTVLYTLRTDSTVLRRRLCLTCRVEFGSTETQTPLHPILTAINKRAADRARKKKNAEAGPRL